MADAFIILGASSWIGHYLVPALAKKNSNAHITAVYRNRRPAFAVNQVQAASGDLAAAVERLPDATVIHLGRGETEHDFAVHRALIDLQNQRRQRYLYASSFNAVDADVSKAHFEADPASAQSEYGLFKARCETEMLNSCARPLIFRFAGIHGWAPNREARTQEFLRKLAAGENIQVAPGILQNRLFAGDLAAQIARLATAETLDGVFHLGTSDFSDEVEFLRRLAAAFGYPAERLTPGQAVECNAVMVVERLRESFPRAAIPTEEDTIRRVAAQPELAEFRARTNTMGFPVASFG